MNKILIVEDDLLIAELERDYLVVADFEPVIETNGKKGLALALEGGFDLLILDVMLEGINGFDICREVRKKCNVPIIMVTAKQDDIDKIKGLSLGIDDYITKPFSPAELVARVKAHIQIHERLLHSQPETTNEEIIKTGDLKIIVNARRVFVGDREVKLKNKEFELLLFLAENPDIVFSKDTILDRIWGIDSTADTATVTVHINRIREKIEKTPSEPEYILTVWGVGYKFCAGK